MYGRPRVNRHPLRRFTSVVFFILVSFLGLGSSPVLAHNSIVSSVPADGAVLSAAPTVWALTFTKEVPLTSASAEIVRTDGVRVPLTPPVHGATTKEIRFNLPVGLVGNVTGRWRLVGTDGHVITARISFTISVAPSSTSTTEQGTNAPVATTIAGPVLEEVGSIGEPTPEVTRYAVRLVGYLSLLVVGGILFTDGYVARGLIRTRRARETLVASSVVMALAPLLQTLIFLHDSRGWGVVGSVFHVLEAFDTTAGSMSLLRFVAGALMVAAVVRMGRGDTQPASTPMLAVIMGVYLVTLAYTGHSRSMAWPLLGVPADVIHTAAVAVWLGGLFVFVFFVIPALTTDESFVAFQRFGEAARYAVVAMVITGVIQTLRLHGTIITLFTQGHGRWLLLKLILVASMLKVGDINRQRLIRGVKVGSMNNDGRVALLRRASITEIVNGALVMAVTAALVSAPFG